MGERQTMLQSTIKAPEYVRESLERIRVRIMANMGAKHRNASGESVRSLNVVMNNYNGVHGELLGSRSFMAMETGRGPGAIPRNFVDILSQWILDKGISIAYYPGGGSPERQLRSVAWFMARAIRNSGTSLFHKSPQDIYSQAIEDEYNTLQEKLTVLFGSDIDYIHEEYAKTDKR